MARIEYVCGVLLSNSKDVVVLIRKNRPENQAGLLNGIGGKVEDGETPLQAMEREFFEEANVSNLNWIENSEISEPGYRVVFFHAFAEDAVIGTVQTMTDEVIEIHHIRQLDNERLVEGLRSVIDKCAS